jgi:transcription factor C subunit 6
VAYDIASGPYVGGALAVEHENVLKAFSVRADVLGRGHTVSETGGPIWVRRRSGATSASRNFCLKLSLQSISTSDYHPYIATAAADGTCMTVNLLKPLRRGGLVVSVIPVKQRNPTKSDLLTSIYPKPIFIHKLYQMDYNRNTKQYRMLQNFIPLVRL